LSIADIGNQWGKVFQNYAGTVGKNSEGLSQDLRLLMLAMSRADNSGHALFEDGELRNLLGKNGKAASRSTVFNVLKKLREGGLILPGGGERCVWLPEEFWDKGRGETRWCPIHQTRQGAYHSEAA
jgi:hypothetical protein